VRVIAGRRYLVYQLEVFFGGFRTLLGLGWIYHRPKFLEKKNISQKTEPVYLNVYGAQ
jgi:hypothetical protein